MADTGSPWNLPYPLNTDLVIDGAQAIEDLAEDVASALTLTKAASNITSGTFDAARIPNLAASKITSGTFDAARLPSGSVLQVVQGSSTSTVTITSGSFSSTGVSVSITPNFSSSKVLVLASLAAEADAGSASSFATEIAIYRGGTKRIDWRFSSSFDGTIASSPTNAFLDSPSTTSSTTYSIRARCVSTGSSRSIRAQDNGAESTITAIEIAG